MLTLDPRTTALLLIDLQGGIVAMELAPRDGATVLAAGRVLAARFRTAGALVVPVRVDFAPDFADAPPGRVDQPLPQPPGGRPAGWSTLAEGLAQPGDLVITKHQWGAFTGTGLDEQLRRRRVRTVVVAGIATSIGVESTVRHAWELGYDVVVVEDACTNPSAAQHAMSVTLVFPRLARVVQADELAFGAD